MKREFVFIPSVSSSFGSSDSLETKSDIIAFAIGNPVNKKAAKLSQSNEDLLGIDNAKLFTRRHNNELQRCSQFYSLASLFNEKTTKDKHRINGKNIQKMCSTARKYLLQLFICT
ncbi:hypothetical protein I4U23_030995 [Adineta vaga]|nr:hypothetical protein I4U23_030995 [Adineta vaga]